MHGLSLAYNGLTVNSRCRIKNEKLKITKMDERDYKAMNKDTQGTGVLYRRCYAMVSNN